MMRSHWEGKFKKLRRTLILVGLQICVPLSLSLFLSPFFLSFSVRSKSQMLRILYFFHLLFISYGFTPNPLNADFFRNNRSCRMSYYAWAHLLHNGKDLQKLIFRSRSLSAQGIAVPWPQGKKKKRKKKKLHIFRAVEVTIFPNTFLPTWNKLVVSSVSQMDFVFPSSLNLSVCTQRGHSTVAADPTASSCCWKLFISFF